MKAIKIIIAAFLVCGLFTNCDQENDSIAVTPEEDLPIGFTEVSKFRSFNSVVAFDESELLIAGLLESSRDLGLLKLDKAGNEIWVKGYFEANHGGYSKIVKQKNNDVIITGILNTIPSIAKLDKAGNEIWCNKSIAKIGFVEGLNAISTIDKGTFAVGSVLDSGFKIFLVKYDEEGTELWRKTIEKEEFGLEGFYPIELDNGDIIISVSKLMSSRKSLSFLKINSVGEEIWMRETDLPILKNTPSYLRTIRAIDNELLIIMDAPRNEGALFSDREVTLAKININGFPNWLKTVRIGESNSAISVLEITTKEIIFLGTVTQENEKLETVLIKMDSQGNEIWRKTYYNEQRFFPRDIVETDEGFIIVGYFTGMGADTSIRAAILKVDKAGNPI